MSEQAASLKERIRGDLTVAMKSRDKDATGTLRMALAAILNAEVAGDSARELSDDEVLGVLTKEVRKRHEAAQIYADAGRDALAAKETAEAAILQQYLPAPLTDEELATLVGDAVQEVTAAVGTTPTMRQMGQVIKAVQARAAGRAEGSRIAAAVKSALP